MIWKREDKVWYSDDVIKKIVEICKDDKNAACRILKLLEDINK